MTQVNRSCDECKYWSTETDDEYSDHFGLGKCRLVKLFWECSEWGDLNNGEFGRRLMKKYEGNKAFVQDASDYRAELITMPDFGCVQFEPRED